MSRKICILTYGSVSNGPRVLKEADALSAAGFDVRVVADHRTEHQFHWDLEIARARRWRLDSLRWDYGSLRGRLRRYLTGARQRLSRGLAGTGVAPRSIERLAFCRLYDEQLRRVLRERSNLIIAHNVPSLPVARVAAGRLGIPFAFDSEDDDLGQLSPAEQAQLSGRLLRKFEERDLPHCAYVTAASELIAATLAERFRIPKPTVVYNVFPWRDREAIDGLCRDRHGRPGDRVSLYWFSQTIGLDRGLQDVIRAAALVEAKIELHLRGSISADVRSELEGLAARCGLRERIIIHPLISPVELLSRSAEHDVGLALEQLVSENKRNTVSNKLFFYMLAGLAVIATRTPGQAAALQATPGAALLYDPGDHVQLAAHIQTLLSSPERLAAMKSHSLEAARVTWNWERESQKLVALVETAMGSHETRAKLDWD